MNTGLSYKNTPFAWSPGTGKGAWGVFVNTPASVTHGVGHPDWSHRSYVLQVDDEALDLFLFAADTPAVILDLYTQLTGRPASVPLWSLGLWVSRSYYQTPEEAAAVAAKLRAHKIPCDVLTLDGRAAWQAETRFDFEWDPDRFPDPRAALDAIKAHNLQDLRLGIPLCVRSLAIVHRPRVAQLSADQRRPAIRTSSPGTHARREPLRQGAHAPARKRHRRLHPSRRLRVVARRARQSCSPTAST